MTLKQRRRSSAATSLVISTERGGFLSRVSVGAACLLALCACLAAALGAGRSSPGSKWRPLFNVVDARLPSPSLQRLLLSDMSLAAEGQPHGVPASYDWARGPRVGRVHNLQPYSAFAAWGQLYRCAGMAVSPSARVEMQGLQGWIFSRTARRWRQVQSSSALLGSDFPEDYVGPRVASRSLRVTRTATFVSLRPKYNFHFWPAGGRASIQGQDVLATVVLVTARLLPLRRGGGCALLSVGGDFWRSPTAASRDSAADAGIGRFKRVRAAWRLFSMSTASPALLERYPLPAPTEHVGG